MNSLLQDALAMLYRGSWIVPHTDADGLSAGALALRARGEGAARAVLLPRGASPFDPHAGLPPVDPIVVLDWGVRRLNRPALFVDHHAPEAHERADQLVLSGYGEQPEVSTSVLVARMVPDQPRWIVAVGAFADLGRRAWSLEEFAEVRRSHVQRLTPLINAPRRLPHGPVVTALEVLVDHDDPIAALRDPRIAILDECRAEWTTGYKRAMRTAPEVRDGVAVIRFSSPYQVHPPMASIWARRLAPNLVVAANDGYLPGRVNFAVRSSGTDDLRERLRSALPDASGEFGHGHPRATGGSVTRAEFDELIRELRSRNRPK
jgi:single-stranded-DNA-specific exonuclease